MAQFELIFGMIFLVGWLGAPAAQPFEESDEDPDSQPSSKQSHVIWSLRSFCVSEPLCTCHIANENDLVADCSNLDIELVPTFRDNVTIIHLQRNRITDFSGKGIPMTVRYIDLSDNRLQSFTRFPFVGMEQLEYLDLHGNHLQYTKDIYPDNVFKGLTSLKYLNLKLQHNMLFTLSNLHFPVSISKLEKLEMLLLDGVDLVGFVENFRMLTKLHTLDLSGQTGVCHLRTIPSNFFQNISDITKLDVSGCNIQKIESGTFRNLKNLHTLNISSNECLTFRILGNITYDLQYTPVRVIDISRLHCTFGPSTVLHKEDLAYLFYTKVTHIYIESNRIAMLETGAAKTLPTSLKFVSFSDNNLSFGRYYLELMSALPNIEVVYATHQGRPHNLETGRSDCNDWRAPPPSSEITFSGSAGLIDCNRNPIRKVNHKSGVLAKFTVPYSLKEFYYSNNAMNFEIGSLDFKENSLEVLDISNNLFHSWKGPMSNLRKLHYVDLSHNYCTYISENFLIDNYVKTLLIQNNLLGLVLNKDKNGNIFRSFTNLERLDLSTNHIYVLPSLLLKHQYKLQILNLSNNALGEFSLDLSEMKYLQYLDLTHNQIRSIGPDQRKQIDELRKNNITINLQGNHMDCSCAELEFIKWMSKNRDIFINFYTYECVFPNGTSASFSNLDVTMIELAKSCDSYIGIIAVFASLILLVLSFTISGIVYRYRWKLRYLFYMAKTRYKGYAPVINAEDEDDFKYDAFISYSSDDLGFVKNEILSNLEDERGLRLCLHQRDFIPGMEIAQNITNAINQSRKTVVVLSRNYLNSYWCIYEFNMARMESIYARDGNTVLLLIFYEKIPVRDLPFMILDHTENDCFIEYPDDDIHGKVVFWDKLAECISPRRTTSL